MKQVASPTLGLAVAMALLAGAAQAQIDSPPPPLIGERSFHLYSVPGVSSGGGTATFFSCTNTTGENIRVGVEVFGFAGGAAFNDASATSLDVFPGGSWRFATQTAFGISSQSDLGVGSVSVGSARILATKSRGIICNAFLADTINAPPMFMTDLPVIKKLKQKGD